MAVVNLSMSSLAQKQAEQTMVENYFSLLGLETAFDVNLDALEKQYITMQQVLHPDRFLDKSEKLVALQKTVDVNAAYAVLKKPLSRAEYLLKLEGIIVNAEKDTIKPSQALLMESLEKRETLMEAEGLEAVQTLERAAKEEITQVEQKIAADFKANALDHAAQNTIRLKYLQKYTEEIRQKRHKLEG